MNWNNTEDSYGLIPKIFHWVTAVLILALLPIGLFMAGMENSPVKFQIYAMHKSFGLVVFFLGLARIVWRFYSPPPEPLETHTSWERNLARAAHFWLYICIIGMPLSGWLMSNAGEYAVPFFGIQMPALIGKDESLQGLFGEVHEVLAYTLLFILALHMAGALKHHFIDKDQTLARTTRPNPHLAIPVLIILFAGISYAVSGYNVIFGEAEKSQKEVQQLSQSQSQAAAPSVSNQPDIDKLPPHGWMIVGSMSKLGFEATLNGAAFSGEFTDYPAHIIFNPDDLSTAKLDVSIAMDKFRTGDEARDGDMKGGDWFDIPNHPTARFVATKFEYATDDRYVAIGDLSIRGKTLPLTIPFSLNIENGADFRTAHIKGEASLDRLAFGLGAAKYQDSQTVGHSVLIKLDITAIQNP